MIKVYAEVLPKWLGRVMYRINGEMKKYAPDNVEFTKIPISSDFQILDVIGTGSFEYLYNKDSYVLLQHCYLTTETQDPKYWEEKWGNAIAVASYLPLYEYVDNSLYNHITIPWGVDNEVFYPLNLEKEYTVFATGYVADTECINEAYEAAKAVGGKMVHVGGDIGIENDSYYQRFENISDEEMNTLYNKSKFVIGMRRGEGFEIPLLEGMSTGAKGITLNNSNYKRWYGDLVYYVDDGNFDKVKDQLVDIFKEGKYKISREEIEDVQNTYSWKTVFEYFWSSIDLLSNMV